MNLRVYVVDNHLDLVEHIVQHHIQNQGMLDDHMVDYLSLLNLNYGIDNIFQLSHWKNVKAIQFALFLK